MRITLQPSYILHSRPYRETSLLLDIFSKEHGRVSLIAKGVRNKRSAQRALLQPFTPLLLSWQGKTELMTLTAVESTTLPLQLAKDSLLAGFYLNELLLRLLPKHDAHAFLYTIYEETLIALQAPLQEKVLRIFEKKLLEELGYGLHWQGNSPEKRSIQSDHYYRFDPEGGFVLCKEASFSAFSGKTLLAILSEELNNEDILKETKRLMRIVFKSLLGDNELKSRALFAVMKQES